MLDKSISLKPFWSLSAPETIKELQTSETGLTALSAGERLKIFGQNIIERRRRITGPQIFFRQLKNPLIFILLVAGGITLSLADYADAIFILGAALVNAGLGFYQENKAKNALEHLTSYITRRTRVYRDGIEIEIDTDSVVPGDVIRLIQGDRVPADARLLHENDLLLDQSILTGESLPAGKKLGAVSATADVPDRDCMVFSGTLVAQGFALAIVTATDQLTELGKIAKAVAEPERESTPLQRAIGKFSLGASIFVCALSIGVFFLARLQGTPALEAFLIGVAILVAAVPEGLPIVMTVIQAIGVQRLAKKNGIIRKLSAAETLGSTSIILTDKTGTLTQAKMSLSRLKIFAENLAPGVDPEEFLLHTALLDVDASVENPKDDPSVWRVIGKPLETAIVKEAVAYGVLYPMLKEGRRAIHILPFNSKNKFSAATYRMDLPIFERHLGKSKPHVLSLMGAPEALLKFSPLSDDRKAEIMKEVNAMADEGDRVIGVALKEINDINDFSFNDHKHLHGLTFLGTISLHDPLRPDVADAVARVRSAGVRIIIVTGDHAGTARAICRQIGLNSEPEHIVSGTDLDRLDDKELLKKLQHLTVIARVSPEGKLRVAKLLQSAGEVVAMTGDGVNDAPALSAADIGIAMGTGTDVAKDVADLVLLDDDFGTIVEAIYEGRRIVANIRKALVYLTSSILNEVFLIGGALVMGLALPINPLQILWVNFFTDSFPGIALAFEKGVDGDGHRPSYIQKGIFTGEMKTLLGISSIISSILLLGLYVWLLRNNFDPAIARTFTFGAFGTYTLFLIFSVRSLHTSVFRFNPFSNPPVFFSALFGFALTLSAIYLPFLQNLFHTVSLPAVGIAGILTFGLFNIILVEIIKYIFNRKQLKTSVVHLA